MFAAEKIAAPLIAGNTVVLKPSEHTSLSALRLADLVTEAFPPGVVNIVTGYGHEAGDALVVHHGVRRLAFIGSVEIGLGIQRRAGQQVVKNVTLELGGKNAMAIFPDADLEAAVDGAVRGDELHVAGPVLRLDLAPAGPHLTPRRVRRPVGRAAGPAALRAAARGDHRHRRDRAPPAVREGARLLQLGREEGARVVVGGGTVDDPGLADGMFVAPTLFDGVRPDSRLAQEEIFGPVLEFEAQCAPQYSEKYT